MFLVRVKLYGVDGNHFHRFDGSAGVRRVSISRREHCPLHGFRSSAHAVCIALASRCVSLAYDVRSRMVRHRGCRADRREQDDSLSLARRSRHRRVAHQEEGKHQEHGEKRGQRERLMDKRVGLVAGGRPGRTWSK